ncbi:MAG: hypothetical protein ACI97A_001431 [Planctomycetota bacterium]|jgi:hypothetical protein
MNDFKQLSGIALVLLFCSLTSCTQSPVKILEVVREASDDDTLIITITSSGETDSNANKIFVGNKEYSFAELHKFLEGEGVQVEKYRYRENPTLSSRQVLIRCHEGQAFDYVKGILQLLANPEIAIYKIEIATYEGGHKGTSNDKKVNADGPTDFGITTRSSEVPEGPGAVLKRFTTVRLRQTLATKPNEPLLDRDTRYELNGEDITGATNAEKLTTLKKKLAEQREENPDAVGKIQAARGIPHGRVVEVLDHFHKAGYKKVTFVGLATNANIALGVERWKRMKRQLSEAK